MTNPLSPAAVRKEDSAKPIKVRSPHPVKRSGRPCCERCNVLIPDDGSTLCQKCADAAQPCAGAGADGAARTYRSVDELVEKTCSPEVQAEYNRLRGEDLLRLVRGPFLKRDMDGPKYIDELVAELVEGFAAHEYKAVEAAVREVLENQGHENEAARALAESKLGECQRESDALRKQLDEARAQIVELRGDLEGIHSLWGRVSFAPSSPSLAKTAASYAGKTVIDRERLEELERAADDTTTIDQRDRAEDAANRLTSEILGEPVDWSDHDAKWREALEEGLPALMEDKARLDWLESQISTRCVEVDGQPKIGLMTANGWRVHLNGLGYVGHGTTVRAAIDAAQNAGKAQP